MSILNKTESLLLAVRAKKRPTGKIFNPFIKRRYDQMKENFITVAECSLPYSCSRIVFS